MHIHMTGYRYVSSDPAEAPAVLRMTEYMSTSGKTQGHQLSPYWYDFLEIIDWHEFLQRLERDITDNLWSWYECKIREASRVKPIHDHYMALEPIIVDPDHGVVYP